VTLDNGSGVKLPKDWISEHASASVGQLTWPFCSIRKAAWGASPKQQASSHKLQATSFKPQASSTKRPGGARHIVAVTKCLLTQDMGCDVMSH